MNDITKNSAMLDYNEKFNPLQLYKHIVFCFPHANSLGIVRAIAKGGLNPIVVSIGAVDEDSGFFHSKYHCCPV